MVDECITHVSTIFDAEKTIFLEHFTPKPTLKLQYHFDHAGVEFKEIKNKTVFIGNSGDPSNKHIDIIRTIAKKKDANDYEYFIPYTYNGSESGLNAIRKEINKLNLKKVTILTKQLNKSDYYELFSHAQIYISAHDRQQGMGHISASFYFGINVVAKDYIYIDNKKTKNPIWSQLVDTDGFHLQSFNDFCKAKRISDCILPDQTDSNKIKFKTFYNAKIAAESFQKAFEQLENKNNSMHQYDS
jgi:hypothetical protein